MVSKNQIKLISSLHQKKFRVAHQLFIAEGIKCIQELLQSSFELEQLYTTLNDFQLLPASQRFQVSEVELKKMSALTTPSSCLAVFRIPKPSHVVDKGWIVALDAIRDPGNLGTILRLCDWFGIDQVLCSKETVDVFNPKVVQATMGSITRVKVSYLDLEAYLQKTTLPVLGTFMEGDVVYKTAFPNQGIIVLGNEANGISPEIEACVTQKITIPRFGQLQQTESLNVATATAIILSECKRRGLD